MTKGSSSFGLQNMSEQAQQVVRLFEMHCRAELAETLITGEASRRFTSEHSRKQNLEAPRLSELALEHAKGLDKRSRKAVVRKLLRRDIRTGQLLPASDRDWLRRVLRGDRSKPLVERTGLIAGLADLLSPPQPFKKGDVKGEQAWISQLISGFLPVDQPDIQTTIFPDEVPSGSGSGEPGSGSGGETPIPWNELNFIVDSVHCEVTTNGEAGPDEISFSAIGMSAGPWLEDGTDGTPPQDISGFIGQQQEESGQIVWDAGPFNEGDTDICDCTVLTWNLSGITLPCVFASLFLMAETDPAGGFRQHIYQVFQSLQGEYVDALGEALLASMGAAVFLSGFGFAFGGPAGALVGVIMAAAFAAVATLFTAIWGNFDELFNSVFVTLTLDEDSLANGMFDAEGRHFPEDPMATGGDGGSYSIAYHWQLTDSTA